MAFEQERIEVEIRFTEQGDEIPVAEFSELLSRLEQMYIAFSQNENIIEDISPPRFNQELFYDEDSRDMFIGRLQRYGVLSDVQFRPSPFFINTVHDDPIYSGLNISRIRKESPLIIAIMGGGVFIAILWIIAGIEFEFNWRRETDETGTVSNDIEASFRFDATSTQDLIGAIREFFE